LDNSFNFSDGLLAANAVLLAGGSGAASENTLELLTFIRPSARKPENVFFSTARTILVANNNVASGSLLGTFTAIDTDTNATDLSYRVTDLADVRDQANNKIIDQLEIVNGNQLRIKQGPGIAATKLQELQLQVTVFERDNPSNSFTSPVSQPFRLATRSFTGTADLTIRSDTTVLPVFSNEISGFNQPILFSATGVSGAISVEPGPSLSSEDLSGFSASDLNLSLTPGEELTQITPLAPMLNFSIETNNPGDVVRFEFELPLLPLSDLLNIKYLKLTDDGSLSIFDYFTDDFGVSTGARLETRGLEGYTTDFSNYDPKNLNTQALYLAVYVQDNGRGDDDIRLGIIRDPGAPVNIGIRAAANEAAARGVLPFNLNPFNMGIILNDPNGDGRSDLEFVVSREARYDNIVNFYRVSDLATGAVTVNGVTALPGQANYLSLALDPSNQLTANDGTKPSLATANLSESIRTGAFTPGGTWLPFVQVINTGKTYLPYAVSNDDGVSHFAHARGSDNYDYLFVEDLPGGGDRDYNDIVIRISRPA
jgi:hypothetical protein